MDPRRVGKQNSGFSDEDIADIVCLLYPITDNAGKEVERLAGSPEYSRFVVGRYTADNIHSDLYNEDDARKFRQTGAMGQHSIVLTLSANVKDPAMGFTFGRNAIRCDICFTRDPGRRLSNIHFRIYVNKHGSIMIEDQSTNGTVVDDKLLRKSDPKGRGHITPFKRTLESGSTIKIIMAENTDDLVFLVRIPRRYGDIERAYRNNLAMHLGRVLGLDVDPNKTIGPGPSGHVSHNYHPNQPSALLRTQKVNLFPAPSSEGKRPERSPNYAARSLLEPAPPEWWGGDKYARGALIGKGAFALVYKVTSRYDGSPYAAKELDKRKFMKNGVLDQKVENEMKIMQKVQHVGLYPSHRTRDDKSDNDI